MRRWRWRLPEFRQLTKPRVRQIGGVAGSGEARPHGWRSGPRSRVWRWSESDADERVVLAPAVVFLDVGEQGAGAVGPSAVPADVDQVLPGGAGGSDESAAHAVGAP